MRQIKLPMFRTSTRLLFFGALIPSAMAANNLSTGRAVTSDSAIETVIVTARKREETMLDVPMSVVSFPEQSLADYNIRSLVDYAGMTPGLSFAYGNGGGGGETGTGFANARTIAIRGVAGARTTAYYIDDTPLPGAIDARAVDLRSIEILRGPQGTLFGESALGGTVRLLTRAANPDQSDFRYLLEGGPTDHGGSLNRGIEIAGNTPLTEKLALRGAAFSSHAAGFLTRSYQTDINNPAAPRRDVDDQGAQDSRGGSLTGLLRASDRLDVTVRVLHQQQVFHGVPAAYAPLPDFEPSRELDRLANIQPEARDRWTLPALTLTYRSDTWALHSTTSDFKRTANDQEDSSEGTIQFLDSYGLGATPPQGFVWQARRRSEQFTHETRLEFDAGGTFSGVAGIYYADFHTHRTTPSVFGTNVFGTPGSTLLWDFDDRYRQRDQSVFGEINYRFLSRWIVTLGNRHYWLEQHDQQGFDGALYGVVYRSDTHGAASGDNPRVTLAWQPTAQGRVYASAAKGFRAGSAQGDLSPFGCVTPTQARALAEVKPDSVWSYEVGGKLDTNGRGLLLTGAIYRIDWSDIQQPAFIPSCGFYLLGNAGAARIDGGELELTGQLTPAWSLRTGVSYADAHITAQGSSARPAGSRIAQIPRLQAHAGAMYSHAITAGLAGFIGGDYQYVGDSVSDNSTALNLLRPAYRMLNARLGISWDRAELSLNASNLANARVNLGDLGYLGYQRFEADGTTPLPQVATLPPRTLLLRFRQSF